MIRLITALTLGTIVAVPAFLESATAQPLDTAREWAIEECSREAAKYKDYTWGVQEITIYRACMGRHGQAE